MNRILILFAFCFATGHFLFSQAPQLPPLNSLKVKTIEMDGVKKTLTYEVEIGGKARKLVFNRPHNPVNPNDMELRIYSGDENKMVEFIVKNGIVLRSGKTRWKDFQITDQQTSTSSPHYHLYNYMGKLNALLIRLNFLNSPGISLAELADDYEERLERTKSRGDMKGCTFEGWSWANIDYRNGYFALDPSAEGYQGSSQSEQCVSGEESTNIRCMCGERPHCKTETFRLVHIFAYETAEGEERSTREMRRITKCICFCRPAW